MKPHRPTLGDVFELKIQLRHIEPAIWRTVLLPAEVPLGIVHEVIQAVFGWEGAHLHDFEVAGIRFAIDDDDEDTVFAVHEYAAPLGAVAGVGTSFLYRYDFGDDWEHEVTVQGVIPNGDVAFTCTGGGRACPPDDCGGPSGYAHLLQVLTDPTHADYEELKPLAPDGFDPEKFERAAVNERLAELLQDLEKRASAAS